MSNPAGVLKRYPPSGTSEGGAVLRGGSDPQQLSRYKIFQIGCSCGNDSELRKVCRVESVLGVVKYRNLRSQMKVKGFIAKAKLKALFWRVGSRHFRA